MRGGLHQVWERLHYFSEIKSTHLLIISAGKEARLVLCLLMLGKPQEKPFIRLVLSNEHTFTLGNVEPEDASFLVVAFH